MHDYFIESVDLRQHPLINAKSKTKREYLTALSYIVFSTIEQVGHQSTPSEIGVMKEFAKRRLDIYRSSIFPSLASISEDSNVALKCLKACLLPWRKYHRICLICDIALILLSPNIVKQGVAKIQPFIPKRRRKENDDLLRLLIESSGDLNNFKKAGILINQYQKNISFLSRPKRRIIVTANMSAGKSTLINALIGKPIARTSQEVCTGNICYIYNKAFEDENVSLNTKEFIISASKDELRKYDWGDRVSISSYFSSLIKYKNRICLIDTPGVNAALYKEHTKLTHNALTSHDYNYVIYVVSPTNLGTDAEKKHLKWVSKNVPKDKIIFVLNKLDDYSSCSDSIDESIQGLRNDLEQVGFEKPKICPISAYFSLLLKQKITGQTLSKNQNYEYEFFTKKFNSSFYDLSRFYEGSEILDGDSDELILSKRTGLYGLEKIIYGG